MADMVFLSRHQLILIDSFIQLTNLPVFAVLLSCVYSIADDQILAYSSL